MTTDMTFDIITVVTTDIGQLATEQEKNLYKNPAANCVKIIIYQNQKKM